jgi:4-amino-4-deoxy-L-arabinose transferase-like glycosyltransferase
VRDRIWLIPLLALFVGKGIVLAALIGPFTGHDEVDHFFYIQRLAQGQGFGEFGSVLLPPAAEPYKAFVADFPYNAEVIQPPLYHLAMVPFYLLIPGDIFAKLLGLRIISVGLGAIVVLLSYALAMELFPDEFALRAGTPVFVAMQPQFSFEAAIVNHDIVVILLATLLVWLLFAWGRVGYDKRRLIWLGVIAGAGILTKVSFGLMLPVIFLAILLEGIRRRKPVRTSLKYALFPCGLALLVALPWFVRALWLYGDPTGAQSLRSIPDYGEQAQSVTQMLFSTVFWRGRLEDFWGNYGWRLIPFDPGTYRAIYLAWLLSAVGLVVLGVRGTVAIARRQKLAGWTRSQLDGLLVIAAWIVMMIAGVIYIGTIQFTQSRFAFPAMAGFGLVTALGYSQLLPRRLRWVVPPIMLLALLGLTVVTAIRFLIPFYAGNGGVPGVAP